MPARAKRGMRRTRTPSQQGSAGLSERMLCLGFSVLQVGYGLFREGIRHQAGGGDILSRLGKVCVPRRREFLWTPTLPCNCFLPR